MNRLVRYLAVVVLLFVVSGEASAQWMKERGWVRKGNRQYEKKDYEASIESYTEALNHDPSSFEAQYDLASAFYRSEKYEEAERILSAIVKDERVGEIERGEVAYNLGNTQFAQKRYKEALDSYRFAMRCNPNDEDAKYNYTLVKRMLQQPPQQQKNDKQQEQNKDKQQQQDKEQQQDQNKENQDNKDKPKEQQGNQDNQDNQNSQNGQDNKNQEQQQSGDKNDGKEQQGGEKPQSAISPEQQMALLQAVQAEEDKTQDKMKEKAAVVVSGGKNW